MVRNFFNTSTTKLTSIFETPDILLKSLAYRLTRTWQPVTDIAFAISAPERPRRFAECLST